MGACLERTMRLPTIRDIPTPSSLLSGAHDAYDRLSTTITDMAAPLDHEEELWPQFEISAQSVTDAFKKYAKFNTPLTAAHETHETPLMKVRGECGCANHEIR